MNQAGRDERVDRYVEEAPEFARPLLRHLRTLVHRACGEVEETMKWSRPFFTYRGRIIANMAAFKAHCSFGLWGPGMGETLRAEGLVKDDASGSLGRLTCLGDLPEDEALLGLLRMALKKADEEAGAPAKVVTTGKRPVMAKAELVVPVELASALARVPQAAQHFAALSRSCRKEYVEWIDEAKRPETRAKRVAEAVVWIAEGRRRNWKYEAPANIKSS